MRLFICIFALVALAMANEETNDLDRFLLSANRQFTAKMFGEVTKGKPNKSVVMSAFSVLSPLSQLAMASVGEAHDEILQSIGFRSDNETKSVFANVNRQLRTVKGIELKIANRVFIPVGNQLNEQFEADSRKYFSSEVKNIDFSRSVEAAHEINEWVENHTDRRIKDLVRADSLDASTQSVLVNAIFFKGQWENNFDKNKTQDRDFHISKDKTIKVPTMNSLADFSYGESQELDAKLLEIFYEGREASFLIILPNEIDGISALTEKLTKDYDRYLPKAVSDMHVNEVDVYLPKFKIETEIDLKTTLQNIGIKKLFSPGEARLDNLLKGASNLYVSDAIQKASIEVNEEGTVATAANAFGIAYLSAYIPQSLSFNANHPFVYTLYARNNPLFMGVYQH